MDFSIEDVKLALAQWTNREVRGYDDVEDFDEDDIDWSELMYSLRKSDAYLTAFGELFVVSAEGGEGQGDYAEIVFSVDNRRFFRKRGAYSSYAGFEWDGRFREVRAVEKTITVYEDVK